MEEAAEGGAAWCASSIVARPVTSDKDVPATLRSLLKGDEAVDALWIPPDPMLLGDETRRFLLAETLKAARARLQLLRRPRRARARS